MSYDLFSFYRSKEWATLCAQIRSDRVNDDGYIICQYCGKPIIKAYDCICHHKVHLTEDNVNDYNISLNPDLIELVHHKCHNYIHNKLGYSVREVFLVYGAPMAGKTTFVKENASQGDLILDIDNIWYCISGCDRYVKPYQLKPIVFKIRDSILESIKYRQGKWNNAYIIGTYPYISERERLIKEMGAREIYINISKSECLSRLEQCSDGRNVDEWRGYIEDWFAASDPPLSP